MPVSWCLYFGGICIPLTLSLYISDEKNGVKRIVPFLSRKTFVDFWMVKKTLHHMIVVSRPTDCKTFYLVNGLETWGSISSLIQVSCHLTCDVL